MAGDTALEGKDPQVHRVGHTRGSGRWSAWGRGPPQLNHVLLSKVAAERSYEGLAPLHHVESEHQDQSRVVWSHRWPRSGFAFFGEAMERAAKCFDLVCPWCSGLACWFVAVARTARSQLMRVLSIVRPARHASCHDCQIQIPTLKVHPSCKGTSCSSEL